MNENAKGALLTTKWSKATTDSLAWRLKYAAKINPALFGGAAGKVASGKLSAEIQMSLSGAKTDVRVWLVDGVTGEKLGDIFPEVTQA